MFCTFLLEDWQISFYPPFYPSCCWEGILYGVFLSEIQKYFLNSLFSLYVFIQQHSQKLENIVKNRYWYISILGQKYESNVSQKTPFCFYLL